jgi:WD40 repeat protein/uncharacterized caspase-like protein
MKHVTNASGIFLARTASRAALPAVVLLALCAVAHAQSPTPSPTPDGRGVGISTSQPRAAQAQQAQAQKQARPELVLQTGYGNFHGATRLVFSPDARLLATTTHGSDAVKLWEVATGRELRTLSGGQGAAMYVSPSVAFSRDGRLVAAGGGDNSVKVWDVATGRELQHLRAPSASVGAIMGVWLLAFSPDGRQLVALSDALRTWDLTTGRELRAQALDSLVGGFVADGVALTPDGGRLVVVDEDGDKVKPIFVDLATGREARPSGSSKRPAGGQGGSTGQRFVSVGTDGRVLMASAVNQRLMLWDLTANNKPRELGTVTRPFHVIGFSGDGRLVALADGYKVTVWETVAGAQVATFDAPAGKLLGEQGAAFVGLSHDGKLLATGGSDAPVTLWDVGAGRPLRAVTASSNMAYAVAFSADGATLSSGGRTRWDLATGRGLGVAGAADRLIGFASPDGRLLASFSPEGNAVKVFDAATRRELHTLAPPTSAGAVNHVAFSPDGRRLATTYRLKEKEAQARFGGGGGGAQAEQQPQQQQSVPTASMSSKELRKMAEEAQKKMMKGGGKNPDPAEMMRVYAELAKSMQGQLSGQQQQQAAAQTYVERQVKIWDLTTGRELLTLSAAGGPFAAGGVHGVQFSADGRRIALVEPTGQVTLWDAATGERLRAFGEAPAMTGGTSSLMTMTDALMSGVGRSVSSVAFSPDGSLLASAGAESRTNMNMSAMMQARGGAVPSAQDLQFQTSGRVRLWEAATGREVATLADNAKEVLQVAFSPDGRLLASAGSDNSVRLWDLSTRQARLTMTGHTAPVNSLSFSPDGRLLASAADDGATVLWDAATGEHLATLVSLFDGADWLVVTPDGLFDGTPASWNQVLWRYDGDTFNVAPIEWFFTEFYHPGLLADIFAGKRPKAGEDISRKDRRQPAVKVSLADAPAADAALTRREVKVLIEVTEAPADKDNPQGSGARDLRLFRNGSLVKAWRGELLQGKGSATLDVTLPVVAGDNRLVAYAFNRDNVKSRDATLALRGADSLKRAGTAYIIAVGVNEYANAQFNLKYAVADATSFGDELRRTQSALGRFERVEVVTLFDREATKANILRVLHGLSGASQSAPPASKAQAAVQPEDAVIIYFAGHGLAHGQRFYLIPHDLGYDGGRNNVGPSGLQTILQNSISDEELERAVETVDAGQLLLVIDACNSGQALEAEEKRRGPMNSKGLAQLAYEKGMYILTAAQSYQAALEAQQLGHGYLTYALIEEGLKTPAADTRPRDGSLAVREWFDYATERVPQMQETKMQETRGLSFTHEDEAEKKEAEKKEADRKAASARRGVQRPRSFYRRELESAPFVIARTGQ